MPIRLLLLLALLLPCAALRAQATDAVPASLAPQIDRAIADLERTPPAEEAIATSVRETLKTARESDAEADRLLAEARAWRTEQPGLALEAARLERVLAADASEEFRTWRQKLGERPRAEELASLSAELRAAADQTGIELTTVATEVAQANARPTELSAQIAEQRQAVDSLRAAAAAEAATPADAERRAAQLSAAAAQRAAVARLRHLQTEQEQLAERRRLLELRQRQLQRESALQERQIDLIEALSSEHNDAELGALEQRLQAEREALGDADASLLAVAERNLDLGRELGEAAVAARDAAARARAAQRARAAVAESISNTRTRLELGAEDEAVGLILLNERRRLVEPEQIARELDATRRELARVQLRLIELDEERDRLDSPERAIEDAVGSTDSEDGEEQAALRAGLTQLFATRAQLLPRIETARREVLDSLGQLERALQQQLTDTQDLGRVLDRQLLWIPSHEPVSLEWLQRQVAGWADLFKPSRYLTSLRLLRSTVTEQWLLTAIGIALFATLLWLRRRVPGRIDELSQPLARVRTDRYRLTLRALLLTALAALPWPLALWMTGWLLRHSGEAGKFSDSLGASFVAISGGVLFWQGLHWLSRERGLGHLHFRWTRSRRLAIRWALPWVGIVLLPMQFLLVLAFTRGQEPALDAAARLLLLAYCATASWISWRLFAPGALWTPRGAPKIEPARLRQLLRVAIPLLLLTVSVLTLKGYVLTAGVMLRNLWFSAGALLAVGVLHGMIGRWFLLGERRLALKRLEQKREAEANAASSERVPGTGDAMPDAEPEEVTLESINAQTRRLLRALTIALIALALISVWSSVLPALARLDDVALWNYSDVDGAGKTIAAVVSLQALLVGLAVLVLTFVAARNLPGLVELGLLSRIHLDAPTRYAITSISRYVIVIGGMIAGLGMLGVRWSQLQWMAAALTVGLGFGLQEIFANFVSGLIVLFERPYRVGDIITIGEVEGTVTRIRTRATTVLDWDNKEVVVPNRTFITERFVNWTLSDSVTRVVLKIGVAYTSDADRVRRRLLEIAESDPRVLRQPPPSCWLITLGASTLDFELRIFVGEIIERNQVRHALYQRIIATFRDEDIEIAFPQMDLWVRNAPPGAAALEAGTRAEPPPKK